MSDPATSAPPVPDDDPPYENFLWSFTAFFPPPYRVLLLASMGVLLFAVNVKVLQGKGVDVFALFKADDAEKRRSIPTSPPHRSTASSSSSASSGENGGSTLLPTSNRPDAAAGVLTSGPLFVFGTIFLIWSLLGWAAYRFYVDSLSGDEKGRHAQALQGFSIAITFVVLVWPGNLFFKPMRKSFGRSVLAILTPSFAQQITFSDVILADILTSYARVFGDVWLTACFLVPRKEHHTWWNGKGSIVVPLLIMFPYAVRFRQCISEFCVSTPDARGVKSKRPLWNALKYASAFPVVWLSAWFAADKGDSAGKYVLWLVSVVVNSLFSFWWDVTNDWGLSLLQRGNMGSVAQVAHNAVHLHRRGTSYMPLAAEDDTVALSDFNSNEKTQHTSLAIPSSSSSSSIAPHRRPLSTMERLLRPAPSLLFPAWMYQLAILLDLVLRFFWSLKLTSHLSLLIEWQGGMFSMEVLEILRRWVWVFFRVEWEVVKRRERSRAHEAMD
ncbi:EXS, C-terminal [Kalmanozyma brasiliensis GHG001]|uniref:EXS domain-containing protein n=1 Tax=Kalmanozyma brasiliensis (strain GHG001) TaxID=1365824 RepID=V5EGN4_KALBG|nr:EXS, C-terminal [Kalmanozyma brasiliensis GHG001]EST09706.1 EXS, C-terminal [Kalmanozyma brasiliensis GHG001]